MCVHMSLMVVMVVVLVIDFGSGFIQMKRDREREGLDRFGDVGLVVAGGLWL